ncbi:cobalamin-dependent protein [Amycolatopsis acidiphila]|uniref:B12-binding domain-containing protein n=1 Tax=Amycolatopsis acidiphila TaxID=715473 RepID=A0A558AHG6_9PSEU|nr:cobalamin-dependent protein [Amycolatopsis acidiphila]TVT23641.1 hypothetical protein FNH06_09030 [Amycolatopsis acidiphila]UIJ58630.1 cobalamin-dependent protein [Amycolatopsis acidiphila]GHG76374.1 methylaspartate mutase [Amycolatopsis acidiphila]
MPGVVIVSSTPSDAHTWNLVFLQLLIEEYGFHVVNLGPCVPEDLLVSQCCLHRPVLVVISSVNGHGYQDCLNLIGRLRRHARHEPMRVVAGGKLSVNQAGAEGRSVRLLAAGFDEIFADDERSLAVFRELLAGMAEEVAGRMSRTSTTVPCARP